MKDLGDPRAPKVDAPVRPFVRGAHRGRTSRSASSAACSICCTDRDAPNEKVVAVLIDKPDPANWKTIVPGVEERDRVDAADRGQARGQRAGRRRRAKCTLYNLDGTAGRRITPPGLGTINGPIGRYDRPDDLLLVHVAAQSDDGVPIRLGQRARARRSTRRS
mgnify:CR=1 FL=1